MEKTLPTFFKGKTGKRFKHKRDPRRNNKAQKRKRSFDFSS